MNALRSLVVVFAGCWLAANVAAQSQVTARTDALGDPLPEGAVARLGTQRLKHAPGKVSAVNTATFSPDGKLLASGDDGTSGLHLWEVASGRQIPGPWMEFPSHAAAFSPDGNMLAVAPIVDPGMPSASTPRQIKLFDISHATLVKTLSGPRPFVSAVVFADGGKTLVLAGDGTVSWWDLASGKEKRSWKPLGDEKQPVKGGGTKTKSFDVCALSPDAKSIAVHVSWYNNRGIRPPDAYSQGPTDHEAIGFSLATGEVTWRTTANYNAQHRSHFAYSADGKRVAIAMGLDNVEVRSAATGKLTGLPVDRQFTGFNSIGGLALSSEGKTVALAGENANVILWNAGAPAAPHKFVARNWPHPIGCVQFSSDNKTLLVGVHSDLQLYDVATLQETHRWEGHRSGIDFLAFTRDGSRLLTGSAAEYLQPREIASWDFATWKSVQSTSVGTSPWPNLGNLSPELSVYIGKTGDERFALHDFKSGKLLARLHVPPRRNPAAGVKGYYRSERPDGSGFFSPSGKFYVLARQDERGNSAEGLYAVPSGKLLCLLPSLPLAYFRAYGDTEPIRPIAFSADDRLVALFSAEDGKIHLCDTATGKFRGPLGPGWGNEGNDPQSERRRMQMLYSFAGNLAFSHDGRLLASWSTLANAIHVWDVATGRELERLVLGEPRQRSDGFRVDLGNRVYFAWAPDSRVLAVGEDKIQLWELASGRVRHEWTGHEGAAIRALAYSPVGRFLASGSSDTTVLIWDMPLVEQAAAVATRESGPLATCWQTLAQDDAAQAFRAIRALTAAPAESVAWIKDRVQPARPIAGKHIEDLIGQLDDSGFRARQKATAELIQIGERSVAAIDKTLAGSPTLETRRRLEEIRKRVSSRILNGPSLQAYRAVEVLERIGTLPARQVLQGLAGGAAGATVTMQAQEALVRLEGLKIPG